MPWPASSLLSSPACGKSTVSAPTLREAALRECAAGRDEMGDTARLAAPALGNDAGPPECSRGMAGESKGEVTPKGPLSTGGVSGDRWREAFSRDGKPLCVLVYVCVHVNMCVREKERERAREGESE